MLHNVHHTHAQFWSLKTCSLLSCTTTLRDVTCKQWHYWLKVELQRTCQCCLQKGSRHWSLFLRQNRTENRKIKAAACTSYVRPVVEYASTVWDPHTRKNIKLEQVQRTSARYVTNNHDYSSSDTDASWPTVVNLGREMQSRLTMPYKISKHLVDIDASSHLVRSSPTTRGHVSKFLQPSCNSSLYANSFFPRTIRDWNLLPTDPWLHQTMDGFKAHLARSSVW